MNAHVIRAIFKRNFVSYFSNPTGYVFICVFVLLSSFAAFWPNEFFNTNLANLDQLNKYLPYIMLVFIPAITMSIWADERRQGTDELLLTIPAGDFDVVLGKYLAAVAIFSVVAGVFAGLATFVVLVCAWAIPTWGCFFGTYLGYWIVGLAMLAIGMVASFLTGNLTVGFILGALFNAPLAFASSMPGVVGASFTAVEHQRAVSRFFPRRGQPRQRRLFPGHRGVDALPERGADRPAALARRQRRPFGWRPTMPCGFWRWWWSWSALNVFLSRHDRLRVDVTSEGLSSLSPAEPRAAREARRETAGGDRVFRQPQRARDLRADAAQPALDAARVAGHEPATRSQVIRHDVEPFSEEATRAEQQFGIRPMQVDSRHARHRTRGTRSSWAWPSPAAWTRS